MKRRDKEQNQKVRTSNEYENKILSLLGDVKVYLFFSFSLFVCSEQTKYYLWSLGVFFF